MLLARNQLQVGAPAPVLIAKDEPKIDGFNNPISTDFRWPTWMDSPYKVAQMYLETLTKKRLNGEQAQAPYGQGDPREHLRPAKLLLDAVGPEMTYRAIVFGIGWSRNGSPSLWWILKTALPKLQEKLAI